MPPGCGAAETCAGRAPRARLSFCRLRCDSRFFYIWLILLVLFRATGPSSALYARRDHAIGDAKALLDFAQNQNPAIR
jgi:hypothetical protein